ncbi:fatty-acid amide hydrolase 2-A isoform X1 [Musca vetustissima]|uniref:fatty-acid amide hydrolase 2-A isoform X1 n=2 Tax=Musca vetustissima TaxID=27455 RepID=UPI002AB6A2A1|nr:fatty-acid amide hydrolase 2-A isoform X1 [Musca vetustissima]
MGYIMRRFLRTAMIVFSWFVVPYSRFTNIKVNRKKLPPIKSHLLEIPAVDLAKMIRTRKIKSEEVVEAYIERCKQVNPLINAIVQDRFEEALEEAREVDRVIAMGINTEEEMEENTPLLGIPVTVKESIAVKGMSNQTGRVFKTPQIAKADAPVVEQIKRAGGIILLVSNTPELCLLWETYNNVTGQTRNPYDLKRTPGGSSGGEAALLASGASLLGLTSDIGGSSRLPAMFSGIWGHKPTPYAVSFKGHHPTSDFPKWGDFFTIAPMTRYAKDLPLLLRCMVDPNGTKLTLEKEISVTGIRFFFMDNDGPSGMMRPLSRDLHAAINRVANDFKAKRVNIRKMKWSLDISLSAMLTMKNIETIYHKTEEGERPKTICTETVKYFFGCSDSILPSVIFGHLQNFMKIIPNSRHKHLATIIEALKTEFKELLGNDGVFIYPTFPNTAHQHYQIYHKLLEPMYMAIFNTLGLPVTNCMIGLDRRRLPMGIQVVANPGQDHLCLAVAREMERRYGGWVRPPSEDSSKRID